MGDELNHSQEIQQPGEMDGESHPSKEGSVSPFLQKARGRHTGLPDPVTPRTNCGTPVVGSHVLAEHSCSPLPDSECNPEQHQHGCWWALSLQSLRALFPS
jgi:hypothetical protein